MGVYCISETAQIPEKTEGAALERCIEQRSNLIKFPRISRTLFHFVPRRRTTRMFHCAVKVMVWVWKVAIIRVVLNYRVGFWTFCAGIDWNRNLLSGVVQPNKRAINFRAFQFIKQSGLKTDQHNLANLIAKLNVNTHYRCCVNCPNLLGAVLLEHSPLEKDKSNKMTSTSSAVPIVIELTLHSLLHGYQNDK